MYRRILVFLVVLFPVIAVAESGTAKGKITINGEEVKGWMEAMSMAYGVDNPEVLKTLKAGDRVEAVVYDKDLTLHALRLVMVQRKQ